MTKAVACIFAIILFANSSFAATKQDDEVIATYDLGVSSGKDTNDNSYTEANLGLNLQYTWLEWRNAVFGRFASGVDTIYGVDTSIHAVLQAQGDTFGFRLFAGPGYRFVTKGENLPFAEGGLVFHLAGISLGGGAKAFFNNLVDPSRKNETQYFIILGGGGRL